MDGSPKFLQDYTSKSVECMGNRASRDKPLRLAVDPVGLEPFGFEDGAHPIIQQGNFHCASEHVFVDAPGQRTRAVKKW
jgi:hypothetical protein